MLILNANRLFDIQADLTEPVFPYTDAASCKLSLRARRAVLSRSNTPQVACNTESKRQSPAVLFQRAYKRLPNLSVNSKLQLMIGESSSSSRKQQEKSLVQIMEKNYLYFRLSFKSDLSVHLDQEVHQKVAPGCQATSLQFLKEKKNWHD